MNETRLEEEPYGIEAQLVIGYCRKWGIPWVAESEKIKSEFIAALGFGTDADLIKAIQKVRELIEVTTEVEAELLGRSRSARKAVTHHRVRVLGEVNAA